MKIRFNPYCKAVIALLGPAALVPAWAADDVAADTAVLDKVEVIGQQSAANPLQNTTKLDLSQRETPQSVTVIDRDFMAEFNADSIRELMQLVPGVSVEEVETDRAYFTARGFDITNFKVDGVGLPLSYGLLNGDIDLAAYERVQVSRGANGLLSGVGNPSATVDLIRKRPTAQRQGYLNASYGSFDESRIEGDLSGPIGESLGARLVATYEHADSYLDWYRNESKMAYGVLSWSLTPRTEFTAGINTEASDSISPLWGALPVVYSDGSLTDYARSQSTSSRWAYWDNNSTTSFADLSHRLASGWLLRAYYAHTRIEGDSELFYMFGSVDPATDEGLTGYASAYSEVQNQDQFDLSASGSFALGGRSHQLALGASTARVDIAERSLYDFDNGFPAIGDLSQWNGQTVPMVFKEGLLFADIVADELSAYVATQLNWSDALSTVGGLRVVNWESDGEGYDEPAISSVNGKLLPYIGASYRLNTPLTLFAGYSETFMPQTDRDIDGGIVEPLTGSSLEAGAKLGLNHDRLIVTASLFQAEHRNQAEVVTYDEDGQALYNGVDYQSQGAELEFSGALNANLLLLGGYAYVQIETADGDEARFHVPEHHATLSTRYRLPLLPALRLGGTLDWQSATGLDAQRREQPAYATLAAFAMVDLSQSLTLSVHGNNLSNEKYYNSLYWTQAYWAAPANWSAALNWKF